MNSESGPHEGLCRKERGQPFAQQGEEARKQGHVGLRGVLSTVELAALSRRSKRAPSGVAQLQGCRGDHHVQRDPPDASSSRNADPDYKHEHERDRWK